MRARALIGSLIAIAALLCACPPPAPPQPPGPDASDAAPSPPPSPGDCSAACAALALAGCALGAAADCPAFMARDIGSGKVPDPTTCHPRCLPLTCATIAQVKTVADAQRLGFVCR